jgi:hypothetical protein
MLLYSSTKLQGGVQFPTGSKVCEEQEKFPFPIWWNSKTDGIVRMEKEKGESLTFGVFYRPKIFWDGFIFSG